MLEIIKALFKCMFSFIKLFFAGIQLLPQLILTFLPISFKYGLEDYLISKLITILFILITLILGFYLDKKTEKKIFRLIAYIVSIWSSFSIFSS